MLNTGDDDVLPIKQLKRLDIYGNPIKKGSKLHRIVFADNKVINRPLNEVHIVESYKVQNKVDKPKSDIKQCCAVF